MKQYKYNIATIFFVAIFSFTSCGMHKDVSGVYEPKRFGVRHELCLRSDSSYSYNYRSGHWGEEKIVSSGTYSVDRKKRMVVLHSYISDMMNIPISVHGLRDESVMSYSIYFNNPTIKNERIQWQLNIGNKSINLSDSLTIVDTAMLMDSFFVTGTLVLEPKLISKKPTEMSRIEEFHDYVYIPNFLQTRMRSQTYKAKREKDNVYYISFPNYVNEDILWYKPQQDTLIVRRNKLIQKGEGKAKRIILFRRK
jgi:hypothetical protein